MLCFLLMRVWLFLSLMVLITMPVLALAQAGGLVPCSGPDCNTNDVVGFANRVIEYLITALGIIAVIVMVVAGFKMVTSAGDEGAWRSAKDMFTNVVIGIILILAAWLIVDTVLKGLTGRGLGDWTEELQMSDPAPVVPTAENNYGVSAAGRYTDAEARAALADAGIGVWESAPGRTSLYNINKATVDEAIRIKKACGCAVTVTGGTESGHQTGTYSHSSGYKIDLDDSPGLNNYITSNYKYAGRRSGDNAYIYNAPNGAVYYKEGDHWDVLVK